MSSKKQLPIRNKSNLVRQPSKPTIRELDLSSQQLSHPTRSNPETEADSNPLKPYQIKLLQDTIGNRGVRQLLQPKMEALEGNSAINISLAEAVSPQTSPTALTIQRWSTRHETTMAHLHSGSLEAAMTSYRNAQVNGEPRGADLEAIKTVIREKVTTEVHRLLVDENVGNLDNLQSTIDAIGEPTRFLQRVFRNRVRQYLRQLLGAADAATRTRLRTLFGMLGGSNWLKKVFDIYLKKTPPMHVGEASRELAGLVEMLVPGQGASERQAAVLNLTAWFRENAVDEEQVRTFLSSAHSAAYKTQILGRIAVQFARAEFLLGWAYQGGYQQGGGWEEWGPTHTHPAPGGRFRNAGQYPTAYQDAVRTMGEAKYTPPGQQPGHGNYAEWCTSFVGFLLQHLGFRTLEEVGQNQRHSMFFSGSRLSRWARTGRSRSTGPMLSDSDNLLVDQPSSVLMEQAAFDRLRRQLNSAAQAERIGVVRDFFAAEGHGPPQPGDVILNPHHTMMVESYDPVTATIATIEGNKGEAVRSLNIVLADPATFRGRDKVTTIIRIGAENFQGFGAETEGAPEVDGEKLVGRITGYVAVLADRLESLDFISAGAGASAQSWQNGAGVGGDN